MIAECNDEAHTTAIAMMVNTGSRDETDDVWGVSHFLEHMAFKGTSRRSADDVNREFDEIGADYNAYTSEENTVYYATVLPEHQTRVVDLLADIVRPALREEDFTTEKQVILEEIQMYADQPPFGADDRVKAIHFGQHPLARSVLGTLESVGGLSVDQMRGYFERRYSPGNVALAAAGRVDFAALVEQADRLCGRWVAYETSRVTPRANGRGSRETICRPTATQEYLLQLANGPSATDDDRFAAKVLAVVLGDDTGSRLYWELVDPGRAESAAVSHYGYQGTGLYMTYVACDPDQAADNLARVADVFARVEADGVSAAELAQAKSKIASRIVLSGERPRGRLFALGSNWINRRQYRTIGDDLASLDAVTLDDVRAVLKRYPLSQSTCVAIGPLESL
ncbi:MAG: pitrilysin family protein [Pirellulales bacterium]